MQAFSDQLDMDNSEKQASLDIESLNGAHHTPEDHQDNPQVYTQTSDRPIVGTHGKGQAQGLEREHIRGGGRGRGYHANDTGGRRRKNDRGRGEWSRTESNKRKRNESEHEKKRRKIEKGEVVDTPFSKEEIEAEVRKPKKKVAVLIGYAGSGYKGMQINNREKTIEGDLFKAFVAASAISKANADDPKKSSLARCARTDKGVHAASNVISLKLIVEDKDVVRKINENLPPQIRVWGIQRTNGAFSCYQLCDSRWYEYLIPTYCFLPPHPKSYLGKKLIQYAEQEDTFKNYKARQEDVENFWDDVDSKYLEPILSKLSSQLQADALAIIQGSEDEHSISKTVLNKSAKQNIEIVDVEGTVTVVEDVDLDLAKEKIDTSDANISGNSTVPEVPVKAVLTPLEAAVKEIKKAHIEAAKTYRISEMRRQRLQAALAQYVGTCNFHNYTVAKSFHEASASRHIRSFEVSDKPIIINDTEWLSLKVHGQSFMMHQIRKMVAMATLLVRCGASNDLIRKSYGAQKISIPKAPGLGLLLERPVFDSYNERAVKEFKLEQIDFKGYQKEIDEFKQREIYERIFQEEAGSHQFHTFFHHIDHYHAGNFLWVTAAGISAVASSTDSKVYYYDSDAETLVKEDEG